MEKKKNYYIDLFSGCGGLSLGLYNSGEWKGVFAVEKNEQAFKTLEYNLITKKKHFNWPDWLPIKEHDINDVLKNYPKELESLKGEIDLVAGGPPCQGFSTAGRREEADLRNGLINSYIEFIKKVEPKVIFFENVRGFTQKFTKNKTDGKAYSEYVKLSLQTESDDFTGYNVYGRLVDFSKYGIPQKRTRFILIGFRKDLEYNIEPKDFFNKLDFYKEDFFIKKGFNETVTLKDAISDLLRTKEIVCPDSKNFKSSLYNEISSNYQKYIRKGIKKEIKSPDSHRFANHREDIIDKFDYILKNSTRNKNISSEIREKFNVKKRNIIPLSEKVPSLTITTLPDDFIHYSEPRIFTVRECARIQSFNDWYEFKGKYTTGGKNRVNEVPRYSQVGNAIPPLFVEQVGIVLKDIIYGK